MIAPPKLTARIDSDGKKKEQTSSAKMAPALDGIRAIRPTRGLGKVATSRKAIPSIVSRIAVRMSWRAAFSLSSAAR